MWYTVWWDSQEKDEFYYNHHWGKETRVKPVKFGYYATDDEAKLEYDFKMFKRWGIDYLILDDTNDHYADGGNISRHIDACFSMARKLGDKAPKLNFAGGPSADQRQYSGDAGGTGYFRRLCGRLPGKHLLLERKAPVR